MKRFVVGSDRDQTFLLPPSLEDYVDEDNPVRVVDAFTDELDLRELGFSGVDPKDTGRPAYHPAVMLKIYIYGYLNQVQSSRRLEREAGRNLELMWLTGHLVPDFKTIANFRKDNGPAIQSVCSQFVGLCRELGLFAKAVAAIDGSKFKAVNARERNHTRGKLKRRIDQVEKSIARYLQSLDAADMHDSDVAEDRTTQLREKIVSMKAKLHELCAKEAEVIAHPDKQISQTDSDARAMSTSMKASGMVGYNVQAAVDTGYHLIVSHEVTNAPHDRAFLAPMTEKAKVAMDAEEIEVLADRGYFSGPQIKACEEQGAMPLVPKPNTSGSRAAGRFDRSDFIYEAETDTLRCPAGEELIHRFTTEEKGLTLNAYWSSKCPDCKIRSQCTTAKYRRIKRWEHEAVVDDMLVRLNNRPDAMTIRRQTAEHVFGTLKSWMGPCHFLTKGIKNVATEMSLSVLAYNIKRLITIMGVKPLIKAIRA